MRILFATTAGGGHVGPLLPFAHACERAGHDVVVAGPPRAEPYVTRGGLSFRALDPPPEQERVRVSESLEAFSGVERLVRALQDLFIGCHARAALSSTIALIDQWDPALVVGETAEYSSLLAAERAGLPQARVGVGLAASFELSANAIAAPELDKLRRGLDLPGDPNGERAGRIALLTQSPPLLDTARDQSQRAPLRFRAPARPGSTALPAWLDRGEEPLVYLSFGSEAATRKSQYFPGLYRGAIDALAGLPVRVLVTIGDAREPAELGPLPSSVHVEQWIPQAAVMAHTAVMVGHGGAGSTLGALAAGVPSAMIPLFADQPINAQLVQKAGAGIAIEGAEAGLPRLADTVQTLIDDPSYRHAAGAIADDIRALPPVDTAVDALVTLAGEREHA
jgi:UDP:flavonoid glycosyltransferase YjiC (YdhE family)